MGAVEDEPEGEYVEEPICSVGRGEMLAEIFGEVAKLRSQIAALEADADVANRDGYIGFLQEGIKQLESMADDVRRADSVKKRGRRARSSPPPSEELPRVELPSEEQTDSPADYGYKDYR